MSIGLPNVVVALFLALVVGMGLGAWGVFLLFLRGKRQLDAAIAYRSVARTLGLEVDTRGCSLQGYLGPRRLWVGEVMVGHGPDRRRAVWGVVDLSRPLALGLQVRRRGLPERVFRRRRSPGIELGNALDQHIEVSGDDAVRVRTLLGDRDVRTTLDALMSRWTNVVLTDSSVRVFLRRPLTRESDLDTLVEQMLAFAGAVEHARVVVDVPAQLEAVVGRFDELAARHGLEVEPTLPALSGVVDGRRVQLVVRRVRQGYAAELQVYFRAHRDTGLRIAPQLTEDGYWSVGQDIHCDDPDFDAAFVVKGWDPRRIVELLDEDVRKTLLSLQTLGDIDVQDDRLKVSGVSLDSASLEAAISQSLQFARQLGWSA